MSRLPFLLFALAACRGSAPDPDAVVPPDGPIGEIPDPTVDPEDDLAGLEALPCSAGAQCADGGEFLGDTCCAFGDATQTVGFTDFIELVDVETDGEIVVGCTGFGARSGRLSELPDLALRSVGIPRCQRIGLGPELADGTKIAWFAHHGDGWVTTPHLWTAQLLPDGTWIELDDIADPSLLFEGIAHHPAGWLYVATHASGVQIYSTDPRGVPTWSSVLDGFDNAVKIDIEGDTAYVIDEDRVHVLDLADPSAPVRVAEVPTAGKPRDVEAFEGRVYVALGGDGLDAFDIVPGGLELVAHVDGDGSAQAVAAGEDIVTVSQWTHVDVLDRDTLQRLATERVTPRFEEDLGIAQFGRTVFVAEWYGLHTFVHRPGYVAPDIWVTEELFAFSSDVFEQRPFTLRNRGPLNLLLGGIETTDSAFSVDVPSLRLAPGEQIQVELSYSPISGGAQGSLLIHSNDPDETQNPLSFPLVATSQDSRIDVGEPLNESFGFLDPTGADDLSNLDGTIQVLAYFALF